MKTPDAVLIRAAELSERVYSESADYLCDLTMPGYVFLAVEGTKEKTDWLTNIKFLFKDGDRHRGFCPMPGALLQISTALAGLFLKTASWFLRATLSAVQQQRCLLRCW
jgi:hypothetical protein